MDFNEETHQTNMLILPAKSKASRIKPLERAKLQFIVENGRLRPLKYLEMDKTGSDFRKPDEITTVLRKAKGIIISLDDQPSDYHLFKEYFKTFNINEPTIRRICRLCMIDQKQVTILPEGREFDVSGRKACQQCAQDEFDKELIAREINLTASGKRHFYRVLKKVKSADKVMEAFDYDFRPTRNPELTLYDVIGNIDDLSASKSIDNLSIPGRMKDILKKNGYTKLLPIQIKALDAGLLKEKNFLIVAGTSSGKTLIG
ncbi:MAG: hypothetical protein ACTSSH_12035, partial [Candidatus Heimdallarchaeota archaeon]